MSKRSELIALKRSFSADKTISYHHRSGDEDGSGGSVLDFYAQAESVEDTIFGEADELAKQAFIKGVKEYMRKVFPKSERAFLSRLMRGKETPQEVGRALGVDWWKHLHAIQKRAYSKLTPLLKLSERTGWSGAEAFTEQLLKRLRLMETGEALPAYTGDSKARAKARKELKAAQAANLAEYKKEERNRQREFYATHRDERLAQIRAYREAHREEIYAKNAAYRKAHREKKKEYNKTFREKITEEQRKKRNERQKAYSQREEVKAAMQKWREAHREERNAYNRDYRARKKAEKAASLPLNGAAEGL